MSIVVGTDGNHIFKEIIAPYFAIPGTSVFAFPMCVLCGVLHPGHWPYQRLWVGITNGFGVSDGLLKGVEKINMFDVIERSFSFVFLSLI